MEGVSVYRSTVIVIDFREVYYDFFNLLMLRLCHFYGVYTQLSRVEVLPVPGSGTQAYTVARY
ncbi:hypothetical protein ACEF06_26005, partial [Brevibacillus agri]